MKRIASVAVLAAFIALPALATAQDIEKGKALYAANKCQTCHAIEGKGNKKYPLDGVGAKLSGEEITKLDHGPEGDGSQAGREAEASHEGVQVG